MNKFFKFSIAIGMIILLAVNISYSKATKRVLLEQVTGAWCQFCPDGTVIMDDILKQYPDKVIGVKIHNGDAMTLTDESTISTAFGLTGVPAGMVDRRAFQVGQNIMVFLNRSNWKQACELLMNEVPKCSVELFYEINNSTRQLTANISATFDSTVTNDLRFNVYICEDDVTGTGSGYDQVNYYNNVSGHPYYGKGNPIKGYHHMKVVRQFMGGPFGKQGSLPSTCQVGQTYTYQFTTTLPANWNIDKLFLVGMVQEYNQQYADLKRIYNSVYGIQGSPSTELTFTGDLHDVVAKGNSFNKEFTIKNMGDKSITYTVDVKKSARTPSDWTATIQVSSVNEKVDNDVIQAVDVTVPKGGSKNITVVFKAGNTLGIGDATLTVVEKTGGSPKEATITAISEEVENIEITDDEADFGTQFSLKTIVASTGRQYLQINPDDLSKFIDDLPNLKYVIWSTGQRGGITAEEGDLLQRLVMGEKGILLTGSVGIPNLVGEAGGSHPFLQSIGLSWNTSSELVQINSFDFKGVQYDPISEGFVATGLQLLTTTPPGFWLQSLNIMNSTVCNIMLNVEYVPQSGPKQTKPIGYRIESGDFRCVVLSFNPSLITNSTIRKDLIDKSLKWIEVGGSSNAPDLVLNVSSLDYETVDIGKSKEMSFDITNEGKSNLQIQKMELVFETGVFSFVNLPALPFTIEPNGKQTVTIKFEPTQEQDYTELVDITSNDPDGNQSVTLYGIGQNASSVSDGHYGIEGMFEMNAGPNPLSEKTIIQYTYNGTIPTNIEVYLIDATGHRIQNLVNSTHTKGTYTLPFTSHGLSNGKYFVIANVNGNTVQMPLVITK